MAEQEAKKPRRLLWVVIGAVALLCLCGALVSVMGGGRNTATTSPTATVIIEERPAAAPLATDTPAPQPTAVPADTPVPEPTADLQTDEETRYLITVAGISGQYESALNGIVSTMQEASDNPALLVDNDWRLRVVGPLAIIKLLDDQVHGLDAPPRFAEIQSELEAMAVHLDSYVSNMSNGLDELDADKLRAAVADMNDGVEHTTRINELLAQMRSQ